MGDVNFQCVASNVGYSRFHPLLLNHDLACCDSWMGSVSTYVNIALGSESRVDHDMFISSTLYNAIISVKVIDCGYNASNHRPVSFKLRLNASCQPAGAKGYKKNTAKVYWFRWDSANLYLADYYAASFDCLSSIPLLSSSNADQSRLEVTQLLYIHHRLIVQGLCDAAKLTVPQLPVNSFKLASFLE